MGKRIKIFIVFCLTSIIISGCIQADAQLKPLCRVVTQVDISCRKEHMLIHRRYTTPEKMESVLLYLRLLKPLYQPDSDPEELHKDVYEIRLTFSDGNHRIYKQKAHRYLAKDDLGWKTIDPALASQLYTLMRQLPSDPAVQAMNTLAQIRWICAREICYNCGNFCICVSYA